MACVLRVSGRRFDVDSYVRVTPFELIKVYKRGEREFPGSAKVLRRHSASGCNILISARDRADYQGQVRDTVRFLTKWLRAVRRLRTRPGVDWAVLDFGVEWRPDAIFQSSHVPEELIVLAAKAGLALEVSMYPARLPAAITRSASSPKGVS